MTQPQGFTLVETLVAITIIVMAIVGPFQIVQQGLLASYVARDELIATALAEEGVEYVRAVRDGNFLYNIANSPRSWLASLDGTSGAVGSVNCVTANGCMVDPTQSTTVIACTGTCSVLNLTTTGVYTQTLPGGAVPTRFTRKVQLTTVTATEVLVTVTVTWSTKHIPFTVTVTDTMHNWL
jgi:prepilin-type N-terminal cleavage/methylation domain-containing protein